MSQSGKPDCLVLDFVGNCGRHSLITPVDVLAEDIYTPEEKALAKKKALAQPGSDARQLLELAREELLRIAKTISSKVGSTINEVDPFDPFNILHLKHENTLPANYRALSKPQRDALLRSGVSDGYVDTLDGHKGKRLLDAIIARRAKGLASFSQLQQLQRFGIHQINLSFETARKCLDYVASTGWGKREPVSTTHLESLIQKKGAA